MRISTAQIFNNGLSAITRAQSDVARTQQQLATGKRILAPSDDPSGALQVLKMRERIASVEQYDRNATAAKARLSFEETVLVGMGDSMQRVRDLTLQAVNATQTDESRAALAQEIKLISASLLDAANAKDVNGEYMFAGFRTASQPFVRDPQQQVMYLGDGGDRRVALSDDRTLAIGHSGMLLMHVPRGNGQFVVQPDVANTGTGRVAAAEVTNPLQVDQSGYRIEFPTADSFEVYDVDDNLVQGGTFASGQAIDIDGRRIVISGAPAAGDSFQVEPAGTVSIFQTLDDLVTALETPRPDTGAMAHFLAATDMALMNIDQSMSRLLEMRTDVGGRLNSIESQDVVNQDQLLQLQTMLSAVEDLDYAEAISRFTLQQVTLQAAQQTYAQMGRMSLFDYLR